MTTCTTLIPYVSTEEFIRQQLERAEKIATSASSSLTLAKVNQMFLIEGILERSELGFLESSGYPELDLAKELATLNGIGSFDCIHSYDQWHLSKFLTSYSVKDHKKIAIYVVKIFLPEVGISQCIDKVIKPGFIGLVKEGIYVEVPGWIDGLKDGSNFLAALQELENDFISKDELKADFKAIKRALKLTSNQISAEEFFNYLKKHPEIKEVYGIIGIGHIDFLDEYAINFNASARERHLVVKVSGRDVNVHLFGGSHGDLAHYEAMSSFVAKKGLTLPSRTKKTKMDEINALVKVLLLLTADDESRTKQGAGRGYSGLVKTKSSESRSSKFEKRINKAAKEFTAWEKRNYPSEYHELRLLAWIAYSGGKWIDTFDACIALAKKLDADGYHFKIMPTKDQFIDRLTDYRRAEEEINLFIKRVTTPKKKI